MERERERERAGPVTEGEGGTTRKA